jgi:LAGLIDADG endonuclease
MQISAFLNTNLLTRSRVVEFDGVRKMYSSFIVVAHNKESLKIIETYFNKFPLFSSKYLDFKD